MAERQNDMKLGELIRNLPGAVLHGDPDVEITAVEYDSRRVKPGALFAAVRGLTNDGRGYIRSAVAAGARAVMADAPLNLDPGVPLILVGDARSGMTLAAAEVHGHPAERLIMLGVTGTNGKTTTTYLLESILDQAGLRSGVVGTVNFRFPGCTLPAPNTTPEGPDLQYLLARMVEAGVSHSIMEVSSHALDLGRVAGCAFDVAVFTNLTQDHLDYHGDLEAYFRAKRRLFTEYFSGRRLPGGPRAVVNVDDERGRGLAAELGDRVLTVSLRDQADLRPACFRAERTGLTARLESPVGPIEVTSRLLGEINLYNVLFAAGAALCLDLDPETIGRGLASSTGAPGRLERVGSRDEYLVLVDYAHTPDALTRSMTVARELKPARLLTVFGCGGDRDRTKRPLMGRTAGQLSDLTIITSDNPRTEDPLAIVRQIEAGLNGLKLVRLNPEDLDPGFKSGTYVALPDRRASIRLACRVLSPGDILLIAGKGHEDYQVLGRQKIHFDDREEARSALETEGKY
ncbi:MAG: UDP-N-acetylmuramoyl-L-alanyl-D-glutamate--2,6-diaminopimelate ligase [Thermodesulfobacteriota bacterium]